MKNSYQEGTAFPPHGQMPVGHVVGRGRASAQNKQAECVQSKERRASVPQSLRPQVTTSNSGEFHIPLSPPLMGLHKYLTWV